MPSPSAADFAPRANARLKSRSPRRGGVEGRADRHRRGDRTARHRRRPDLFSSTSRGGARHGEPCRRDRAPLGGL